MKLKFTLIAIWAMLSSFAVNAANSQQVDVVLPTGVSESTFGDNTVTDGTNYYATLQAAVEAVAGQANAVLYCKPDAELGNMQHAPVVSTLTIYGNGASVTGFEHFDLGNTDKNENSGLAITGDMTLTIKNLDGFSVWGAKSTAHGVNVVIEECEDMGKVFITGTTGILNIAIEDSEFKGREKEAVYSNADGAITLTNVAFSNLNKAINLNHKAAGTQTVTISGCSFTNCGANVAAAQIPVRVLTSVEGGKSVLNVSNTTFTGTPEGGADILLDYGVGVTEATVSNTAANVLPKNEDENAVMVNVTANQGYTNVAPTDVKVATLAELQAALADDSNESPIVVTAQIVIPQGETVVLDLNGKTVNSVFNGTSTTNHIYALSNKGTLTIQGNGSINSRGIYNYGSLTLNAGAINAIDGNGGYAVNNQNGSTFVMNGGVVAATNEDDNMSSSGGYDATALKVPAGCTATLNGGTINNVCDFTFAIDAAGTLNIPATSTITVNGTHGAIAVSGGTTTIDAGTFQIPADEYSRTDNVLYVSGGSLVVNGGTFIGDSDTASGGSCLYDAAGKAVVNGGTFKGSSGGDVWGTTGTTIKGGTFENLTEKQHIADGYELGEDGKVTSSIAYVAKIGETKYETLEDAVAAANAVTDSQVTITLLADIDYSGDDITANVVLDLNGKTVTSTGGYLFWLDSGKLIVKDSSAEKTGKLNGVTTGNAILVYGNSTLVVEDVDIFSNNNVITTFETNNTVTINGGKLEANSATQNSAALYLAGSESTVTVNAGTIIGNIPFNYGTLVVNGGSFTKDVSGYCAAGYATVLNEETGMYEIVAVTAENAAAKIGDRYFLTLNAALQAATDESTIVVLKDFEGNLESLKGTIVPAEGKTVTVNATNTGWYYLGSDFTIGEGVTFNMPDAAFFVYYTDEAVIKGKVTVNGLYIRYAGTRLTVMAPGALNVTGETFIIRDVEGDGAAGLYIVGDDNDETVELTAPVVYFYQGVINAKDAEIKVGTYWQTQETDANEFANAGSANLVLDNSTLNVSVNEHNFKATGNSTVTLTNGSSVIVAGGFVTDAELSIDATSYIQYKGGKIEGETVLTGEGTEASPYLIASLDDLKFFRDKVNADDKKYNAAGVYFELAADIDMTGENWVGIGSINADHGFMGNFDGKNFKIKNLTINNPALVGGYAYAGLFSITEGTDNNQNFIKNLTIENVTINTTGQIVSAAIAYPYYTIIENVKVCGNIAITGGDYTAGVLAYTRRCVNASNLSIVGNDGSFVKGAQVVGGVISDIQLNGGLIADYSNFSAEGVTISGTKMVGGISGIIATQTLNGATVENVTLSSGDSRVGTISGAFGGTSTISNVTVENVTGATAIVGATYDGGKPAQILEHNGVYTIKSQFLSGEGTEENPYLISSVEDILFFRNSVNAGETQYNAEGVYVALGADIDLAGIDWSVNIGDDCNATFDGIFDGKDFTISNLTSTETAKKSDGYICTGLFGAIGGNAVVKNFTIENVTINAEYVGNNVAAVVGFGYSAKGSIENVKVIGDININAPLATGVSAIVGYDYYSPALTVKKCVVKGNDGSAIVGKSYTGGLVGYASSKIAMNNNTVENVTITATGSVGAVAGIMLAGGSAADNTVKNVTLSATGELWANSAAVVAGTITTGSVTVSNTTVENVTANGAEVRIVGGIFVNKPTTAIAKVQAQIGDKFYTTLQAAATAAKENETITLIADVEAIEALNINCALDLNGHSLMATVAPTALPEGYAALPNLDGKFVIGAEPTATVNNLGMTTVAAGDYAIWDGSFDSNTEDDGDMPLSFVMQFLADQTEADMATSPFADWYGDFVLTFTGLENGSFTADNCYLAGHYGSFGWVKIPVDGMVIEDGARYPVMLGVGMGQKYDYICSSVEDFKCALYLAPEILEANPNIQVKLELGVVDNSKGQDAATEALMNNENVYSVTDYTYYAQDFDPSYIAEFVIDDANSVDYEFTEEKTVGTLTYKRTLIEGIWNPLYLPFEIDVEELVENYDIAYYNQMHSYDSDNNGSFDSYEMEVAYITSGTLRANYPYFIRPKNADDCELEYVANDVTLYPAVEKKIQTSSVANIFTLSGTHKAMNASELADCYAISVDGDWSATAGLKAHRLYLKIDENDNSPFATTRAKSIRIVVAGEGDGTTGIEGVEYESTEAIYDLSGRRVQETVKGGIYIVNGKKVYIK